MDHIGLIGQKLQPFMPETAEKISKIVNAEKITKAEPLFPRI
jgi:methionyl-tRNA synthetase